ncbi:hypothetical protein T265_14000, partial [Opisthorchis viverrini]
SWLKRSYRRNPNVGIIRAPGISSVSVTSKIGARWLKWLGQPGSIPDFVPASCGMAASSERVGQLVRARLTNREVRGSNSTSASRLHLSRLGQPSSIPALVPSSYGMAARHRKGATVERFFMVQNHRETATVYFQW